MYSYVVKRLLLLIPIILGVTFIVFFILDLTPGDPGRLLLGPLAPQEAVDRKNEELGYNNPFFTRYLTYMGGALRGDFGESYRTGQPVFDEIIPRFPTTLTLAFLAVLASTLIGIPLGILSAVRQYSKLDTAATISAMFVSSVPDFWLGLMLMLLLSLKLRLLPPDGIDSPLGYIMPTLALSLPSSASILRLTRTTMLETIRQDYIRTARAKGASEKSVIWHHALKNALLPVITVVGSQFGYLLGGSIVVETVFSVPGLGMLTVTAIKSKDMPQVMASIIFLAILFVFIMLLVDLLYAFIDPRIKARYKA